MAIDYNHRGIKYESNVYITIMIITHIRIYMYL